MTKKPDPVKLRVLCLEDSARDIELLREFLLEAGFDLDMDCTATENEFLSFLQGPAYDIILADFKLPGFDAFGALRHSREICPDVPFICVSGSIGEEAAVELLKQGAVDYLLKDQLEKLPSAIKRALAGARERQALRFAEKALQASETRYRRLFETAKDGLLILDAASGIITEVNPCLIEMLGLPNEKFLGKKIWEMEFFKNIAANQDSFTELQRKDYWHYDDLLLETMDGRKINVEFVSNAYKANYRKVIRCNFRDITERKRIEKALLLSDSWRESILAAVPDIIVEVNNDKVYTWANRAGLDFFGNDVIGKEARYYFEGEQETYTKVQPLFYGDENVIYIESWQRRKDGEKRLLAWWCRVRKDETGNVIGALSSAQDITERKLAEEEIKNRIMELERFHRLTVGRETKMIELKQIINELSARLGLAPPYLLDFAKTMKSDDSKNNDITGDKIS